MNSVIFEISLLAVLVIMTIKIIMLESEVSQLRGAMLENEENNGSKD